MLDIKCIHNHSFWLCRGPLQNTIWLSVSCKRKVRERWQVIHMLSFDGIWAINAINILLQVYFKTHEILLGKRFTFVTTMLKMSCKVFLYVPNVQDPKDLQGNHALVSGNPFSIRKLVGQPLQRDVQGEANHDALSVGHDPTKHPKAAENTGL